MAYSLRYTPTAAPAAPQQEQPSGVGRYTPPPAFGSPPPGSGGPSNYYGNAPAFGDGNKLPGAQGGVGADANFDPYGLPGAQQSPGGSGGNPGAYTDPNGDPFNQPTLGGTIGSRNDPNAGQPTGNPNATPGAEAPLAGPGYQEDWYKTYGDDLMQDKSASEDLYSKGVAGSNPYYDFAQQQATKAINDASAARGNFNSSYTMNQIGKTVADIRGQQAHELGMLAGQADAGKFGRYDRGERYAGDAQSAMEGRANRGLDADIRIGEGQANLVNEFYKMAADGMTAAEMARIEASLKASGLTAAEAKQMMDQLSAGVDIFSKFYNPTGGGGGGGGSSGGAGPTLYV